MTNLVSHLREVVREHPEETAISVAGNETTYAQLWAMTGRFAAALVERGVEPGDAVAVYLPNLPQFVASFYGVLRGGGVVVPVNPQYGAREIRPLVTDSEAVAVVTTTDLVSEIEEIHSDTDIRFIVTADGAAEFSTGFADFVETDASFDFWELADRDDDEMAVLPYTSGTTGDPKGAELTNGNLVSNARAMADLVPDGIGTDDAALGALPLFHIYGLTVVMNATLLNGGTFYPMAQWDAGRALELVDEAQIDIFHGVPAMYIDALDHPEADAYDLSSLRLAGVGGSGIPAEVLREVEGQFDVTLYEGYGLTETSPVTHFNAPESGRRAGSIGKALPDIDARIVDSEFEEVDPVEEGPVEDDVALNEITGELVVAGPNVMNGYHDLPDANEEAFTDADGERWFHTGDVAYHDEDGYVYVVDRMTDVIVTGGYNVYPREVEELLYEHEAVADAAVAGTPDERRGETVKAFVVARPGTEISADDVREYCLEHLAEYKHPRVVEFVDELPRTSTGKVRKFKLQEQSDQAAVDGDEGEIPAVVGDDGAGVPTDATDVAGVADEVAGVDDAGVITDAEAAVEAAATDDGEEDGAEEAGDEEGGADAEPAVNEADSGSAGDGDDSDGDAGKEGSSGTESDDEVPLSSEDGHLDDIEDINGVGSTKGDTLREAGFETVEDVRTASQEELAEVDGIGDALAEQIKRDVADDD